MFRTLTRSVVALMLVTGAFGCEGAVPEEDVPSEKATALTSPSQPTTPSVCLRTDPSSGTEAQRAGEESPGVKRTWPCNGYVENLYSSPVQIWSDYVYSSVAAYSASDRFSDDVDFVLEPCSGRWLKIGPRNATVWPWGCVTGYLWAQDPPK